MHTCPVSGYCNACYQREWRKRQPKRDAATARRSNLKYYYGLTQEGYDALLSSQNDVCALCRQPFGGPRRLDRVAVDHCHNTGKVRGLVHGSCNLMIAHAADSPEVLRMGATYLESSMT